MFKGIRISMSFLTRIACSILNIPHITYHSSHKRFTMSSGYLKSSAHTSSGQSKQTNHLNDPVVKNNMLFLNNIKRRYQIGKFLDVGCASGDYLRIIRENVPNLSGLTYYGTDIDDSLINDAKLNNKDGKFFVSYAQKINKQSKTFDIVYCSGMLQYTLLEWKEAVSEAVRVSKEIVIFTRLPLVEDVKSINVEQRVQRSESIDKRYFILLNKDDFESFITNDMNLTIVKRDRGGEKGQIFENGQMFYYWNYILIKNYIKK